MEDGSHCEVFNLRSYTTRHADRAELPNFPAEDLDVFDFQLHHNVPQLVDGQQLTPLAQQDQNRADQGQEHPLPLSMCPGTWVGVTRTCSN
eukprot:jgi/Botrbrau1/18750/Bobra.0386s0073.1